MAQHIYSVPIFYHVKADTARDAWLLLSRAADGDYANENDPIARELGDSFQRTLLPLESDVHDANGPAS